MGTYFDDVQFRIIAHRFLQYSDSKPFSPLCNSLEFISKGQVMLERDGTMIELAAPVLFWMKEGHSYRFFFPEKTGKCCEHIYFDFSGKRSRRIIDWLHEACPEGCLHPADPARVNETFFEMLKYYRDNPAEHHARLVFRVEKLMLLIHESLSSKHCLADDPYGIYLAAEKIRREPFHDFDFRDIAAQNGISYDHFRRLFREKHKMPPLAYIRNQRMFRAAELLRATNMRIKEIVFACRFDSFMEFSRSFKRYSGFSPRAYRKKRSGN